MMKKSFILTFSILCLVGLWKNSQTNFSLISSTESNEASKGKAKKNVEVILANDLANLEKNLAPETISDPNWHFVNDYSKEASQIINKNNYTNFFKLAKRSILDLSSCLKKDFCGMEKRNEDDAYFDEMRTPGHILLGRNLDFMKEALKENPSLSKEIDWDIMEELTENENEKIQILAIEIIKNYNPVNETEKLIQLADRYRGNAKAGALVEISKNNSNNDHVQLINTLEKSFLDDDPNTVISIVEKIKKMRLKDEELIQVAKKLCHFKENGSDDHNWKMLKYDLKKILDLEKLCN